MVRYRVGAVAVAIVAIVSGDVAEASRQRLKAEQRMAMVARGMPLTTLTRCWPGDVDDKPVKDPMQSLANARRTAIVLMSSGVGLTLFFICSRTS